MRACGKLIGELHGCLWKKHVREAVVEMLLKDGQKSQDHRSLTRESGQAACGLSLSQGTSVVIDGFPRYTDKLIMSRHVLWTKWSVPCGIDQSLENTFFPFNSLQIRRKYKSYTSGGLQVSIMATHFGCSLHFPLEKWYFGVLRSRSLWCLGPTWKDSLTSKWNLLTSNFEVSECDWRGTLTMSFSRV